MTHAWHDGVCREIKKHVHDCHDKNQVDDAAIVVGQEGAFTVNVTVTLSH